MFTFFKINSEEKLEWDHDPQDLSAFIVLVTFMKHQLGYSTYILSNRRNQKEITKKYSTTGHSRIRVISQFDVALETSISCLSAWMCVIGIDALKTFLGANRDRPFAHARLKRVLEAIRDPAAPNIEEPAGVPDIDQEEMSEKEFEALTPETRVPLVAGWRDEVRKQKDEVRKQKEHEARMRQLQQPDVIHPSVWHTLEPSLFDRDIPLLDAIDKKEEEQGIKRKVLELDMETETANRDSKKRRIWKASLKPVTIPAPPGTKWYQGLTEESELFIRECTIDCFEIMWKAVEGKKKKWNTQGPKGQVAFIITGPPGLGKSWSSNTIVWQLLKKRQNIWFHSASDHTLTTFAFEGDAKHPTIVDRPEKDVIRRKPSEGTWFLYDSIGGSSGTANMIPFQHQNVCVPCVIFSSPKETNYKQGIKRMEAGLVWYLWMPSWEWPELKAVMPSFYKEYGGGTALGEFEKFISALHGLWGGIPRRLTKYCETFHLCGPEAALGASEEEFMAELNSLSVALMSHGPRIVRGMLDNIGESRESSSSRTVEPPSWLLFPVPIDSEWGPYKRKTYKFCSRQAELGFLDHLAEQETDAVRRFCRDVFKVPGTIGIAFERFAHFVLTRTESNKFRWKQYVSGKVEDSRDSRDLVELPKCLDQKCEMKENLGFFRSAIEECIRNKRSVVIDPIGDQQDAIDMFVVCKLDGRGWCVLAMQDTISKTHSFHPVKILEYRQAAEEAFRAAMPDQEVRDDFFLHVVVVPKEEDNKPFRLQGATMTKLALFDHVVSKFQEIGLGAPSELDNWTCSKAKKVCQAAKLKGYSQLNTNQVKMAGAEILLLNAAEEKVKGLTWVLDGILNQT
ncbi:hypothetical protein IV203_000742 [Nitzschia inconspicua]|uniref:Uncharacterized protein n=1 Tax=Nitzschia inconspicua TaxID=303405 RepID=A0A9K3L807_9STRA|nr:hypothetical protein IV203_000742 [Nitzschia inconspicua]